MTENEPEGGPGREPSRSRRRRRAVRTAGPPVGDRPGERPVGSTEGRGPAPDPPVGEGGPAEQTRDDTDVAGGDWREAGEARDDDERFLRERPPHW